MFTQNGSKLGDDPFDAEVKGWTIQFDGKKECFLPRTDAMTWNLALARMNQGAKVIEVRSNNVVALHA